MHQCSIRRTTRRYPSIRALARHHTKQLSGVKEDEVAKPKDALSIAKYVIGAFALGGGIWAWKGPTAGQEYFAGYLLEQSLSVDNLFVFILCFNFFKTPPEYQAKVLNFGIFSAAALRLVMILLGEQAIEAFKPVLLIFAAILVYSSFKILLEKEEKEEDEDLSTNPIVTTINRIFTVTDSYRGDRFFVVENDVFKVTPLFVVLVVIEISDIIFAADSLPAVFGVTLDPLVIYTSNIAAILSLRALYGFVATVIAELRYLNKAVAVVLAFIGAKLILDQVPGGFHVSTTTSLLVVVTALGAGTAASLLFPESPKGRT
jgi:TerC family integral membrane protein